MLCSCVNTGFWWVLEQGTDGRGPQNLAFYPGDSWTVLFLLACLIAVRLLTESGYQRAVALLAATLCALWDMTDVPQEDL